MKIFVLNPGEKDKLIVSGDSMITIESSHDNLERLMAADTQFLEKLSGFVWKSMLAQPLQTLPRHPRVNFDTQSHFG